MSVNQSSINNVTWDEFDVASDVTLTGRVAPGGGTWALQGGTFSVRTATDDVIATVFAGGEATGYVIDSSAGGIKSANSIRVSAKISAPALTNDAPGVISRWTAGSTFICGRLIKQSDGTILASIDARNGNTTYVNEASANIGTYPSDHIFSVELVSITGNGAATNPGSVYLYVDSRLVCSSVNTATTAFRTRLSSIGYHGIISRSTVAASSSTFDDFQVMYSPASVTISSDDFNGTSGSFLVADRGWNFYTTNSATADNTQATVSSTGKVNIAINGGASAGATAVARYYKDALSSDMWAEVDFDNTSAALGLWPLHVRSIIVNSAAIGICKTGTTTLTFGTNAGGFGGTTPTATITTNGSYRLRIEVVGTTVKAMYRLLSSPTAEWTYFGGATGQLGYTIPAAEITTTPSLLTSTYAGFGYHLNNTSTNALDNFATGKFQNLIMPNTGLSATTADMAPMMPTDTAHGRINWYEPFSYHNGQSLVDFGFTKRSGTGYASGLSGIGVGNTDGLYMSYFTGATTSTSLMPSPNMIAESNFDTSTWLVSGVTKVGKSTLIPFLDGFYDGQILDFAANSVARVYRATGSNTTASSTYTFSVWLATETGTATIRLSFGPNTNANNTFSPDLTVTTTPQRFSLTFTASSTSSYVAIYAPTTVTTQRVVAWGAQVELGTSVSEFKTNSSSITNIKPGIWSKPVLSPNHFIECDLVSVGTVAVTTALPIVGAVRVLDAARFVGIVLSGADYRTVNIYSPNYVSLTPIGTLPSYPCRIRIEVFSKQVQVYYGPTGTRDPTTPLGSAFSLPSTMYSGYDSASETGFGIYPVATTTNPSLTLSNIMDDFESGEVIGEQRVIITPLDAVSATKAERARTPPADTPNSKVDWYEIFSDDIGSSVTSFVDNQFTKRSTYGYALAQSGISGDTTGGSLVLSKILTGPSTNQPNRIGFSNALAVDWATGSSGSTLSTSSVVKFFDGYETPSKLTFVPGVVNGAYGGVSPTISSNSSPLTMSAWMATESGTTTVRFMVNLLSNPAATSPDIVVDSTPRRYSYTFTTADGSISSATFMSIANGSSLNGGSVVIRGVQLDLGTTATELVARQNNANDLTDALWTKTVSSVDQYVECDLTSLQATYSNVIVHALRAVNSENYLGISATRTASAVTLSIITPAGLNIPIGDLSTFPCRLRTEIIDSTIQIYAGPPGVRNPSTLIYGPQTLATDLYPGFMTSTETGFGFQILNTTAATYSGAMDTYESGAVLSGITYQITPDNAVSSTSADYGRIPPPNTPNSEVDWWDNFTTPDLTKTLVEMGFDKRSTYGSATARFGVSGDTTGGTLGMRYDNIASASNNNYNRYSRSNSLLGATLIGSATRSTTTAVEFFDGSTSNVSLTFSSGTVNSGIRLANYDSTTAGTTVTVSAWVASTTGSTTVRLVIGNEGSVNTSQDFVVTTIPTRISYTATATASSTWCITNGSGNNGGTIAVRGLQYERDGELSELVANETETGFLTSALWVKPVSSTDQYVECDLVNLGAATNNIIDYVPIALRAVNSMKYIGVRITGSDYKTIRVYSPAGLEVLAGVLPDYPCRIRAEIHANRFQIWIGPSGIREPSTLWFSLNIANDLYPEFLTSTETGMGFVPITTNVLRAFEGISDTYESGRAPIERVVMDAIRAVSSTRADTGKIMPGDTYNSKVDWYENFTGYASRTSLVDIGFEKPSGSGFAYVSTDGRVSYQEYQYSSTITNSNESINRIPYSSSFNAWILSGSATRSGSSSIVTFFEGTKNGTKINFSAGTANSGIRQRSGYQVFTSGTPLVFSIWLATETGTTTVRLMATNTSGVPLSSSSDFTVTTTPQRFSFNFNMPSSVYVDVGVFSGSGNNGGTVVAWGGQLNTGTALKELVNVDPSATTYLMPGVWAQPVSDPDQYIECDVYKVQELYNVTQLLPALLRVVDATKFVGITTPFTSDNVNQPVYVYTSSGAATFLGNIPKASMPCRIRIELRGNKVYGFYGPVGIRDPQVQINTTPMTLSNTLYSGFLTAQKTGIGSTRGVPGRNDAQESITDEYESGAVVGPPRVYITANDATSTTRADIVKPVDVIWYELFNGPAETPLVDLGFEYKTDEETGEPNNAVIGTQNRLTLKSSNNAAASWTKSLAPAQNQYIQADLYVPPYDDQYFMILRATDQNNFIGMRHDLATGNLILGYKVNGVDYVLYSGPTPTLPSAVRIEVVLNEIKAFTGPVGGENGGKATTPFGSSAGYRFNEATYNILMTGENSGVARSNSTQSANILDNYMSGEVVILPIFITPTVAKSTTRADVAPVSMVNNPQPFKAISDTRADEATLFVIPPIALDADDAFSSTTADNGRMSQENLPQPDKAISNTTADMPQVIMSVFVDGFKAVSETLADVAERDTVYANGFRTRSITRADRPYVQMANLVTPLVARSQTRADSGPINGDPGTTVDRAVSATLADMPFVVMNPVIDVDRAVSTTLADATTINPATYTARPWIFT